MYNTNSSQPVQRLFQMEGDTFVMFSKFQGEFCDFILRTSFDLLPVHHAPFVKGDPTDEATCSFSQVLEHGENSSVPFEFRLGEMQYFLQIVPLFNPINRTEYGLPQTQTDLP